MSAPSGSAAWSGQRGAVSRLLLLRHGQTPLSVEKRYSGLGDPALTDLGLAQADAAAERMAARGGIDAILCSPLLRARQTAEAVSKAIDVPVEVRAGLIETDFGSWEGLTFLEARERDPELFGRWLGSADVAPPGGESFETAGARVDAALTEIVAEFGGRTVLLVSHVTPIKLILQTALGVGESILYRLHLDLASLSVADFFADGNATVRLVNDTSHLGGPDSPRLR
ncbi:histidine phosphatase family protein [Pseudonocardia sp. WMMC193]|uniref:histidine phosphatase family protein n=1 Tax=Pseudonocardia sp. WMMC193 TaxID=2911965 RepID=UPI0027E1DCC4|nr:histidine phosphatase family protein [Pseudonocardia sp. WMMC193]